MLFTNKPTLYARTTTKTSIDKEFTLNLQDLILTRQFPDAAPFNVNFDHRIGFHTLRVFQEDDYYFSNSREYSDLTVRVFRVPDMQKQKVIDDKGNSKFHFKPGDYLVELYTTKAIEQLSACWGTARPLKVCGG